MMWYDEGEAEMKMMKQKEGTVAPSLWTVLCHAACVPLTCTRGERETRILIRQVNVSTRDCEGNSRRAMAEGEEACDKGSESPDLGDEWTNWRVDDPELESDEEADEGVKKKMEEYLEKGEGRGSNVNRSYRWLMGDAKMEGKE